jgi:uncharacterized protein YkwD
VILPALAAMVVSAGIAGVWFVSASRAAESIALAQVTADAAVTTSAPQLGTGDVEADLFLLLNEMRRHVTMCGRQERAAVVVVQRSVVLDRLARAHALDMAQRGFFNHVSPDGFGPSERAQRAGYVGDVSENLAWGQRDAASAVAAWRKSADHCRSVMSAKHRAVGIAHVLGNRKDLWVAVFGSVDDVRND